MKYIVYYNENERRMVRDIYWHEDDAYEEWTPKDVCIAYMSKTEFVFDDEASAQAKADELNGEQSKVKYSEIGDKIKEYYVGTDEIKPHYNK